MKPIWSNIILAVVFISALLRMAANPIAAVISACFIAALVISVNLYGKRKISISERTKTILKKIGTGTVVAVGIIYLVAMTVFAVYKVATEGDFQGIIVLAISGIVIGVLWYMSRWRRWWVRFLKTFLPKGRVRNDSRKFREDYYMTFDYDSNARYGLRINERIFEGRAMIWLDPKDVDASLKQNTACFYDWLKQEGIEANMNIDHLPGCIYAHVATETKAKSMSPSKLQQLRDCFRLLARMNYKGDYYGKYRGELGTIFFESTSGGVIRAIRTDPCQDHYFDYAGFGSDNAYFFVDSYPDWNEGEYELINEPEFFRLWHGYTDYADADEAFCFFESASRMYFGAVANGDKKEQTNSQWDIENASKYMIARDEVDKMKELLSIHEDAVFWAAKMFHDVIPELCEDAARSLVENCDNPVIVRNSKRLLTQWKKGGNA